eukprot:Rmarinus@m.22695
MDRASLLALLDRYGLHLRDGHVYHQDGTPVLPSLSSPLPLTSPGDSALSVSQPTVHIASGQQEASRATAPLAPIHSLEQDSAPERVVDPGQVPQFPKQDVLPPHVLDAVFQFENSPEPVSFRPSVDWTSKLLWVALVLPMTKQLNGLQRWSLVYLRLSVSDGLMNIYLKGCLSHRLRLLMKTSKLYLVLRR